MTIDEESRRTFLSGKLQQLYENELECVLLGILSSLNKEYYYEKGEQMSLTTEHIWEAFHAPLQGFIRKRVVDEFVTEDLLQDVFLKIHEHIETLQDVKKLESWVYQITRNAIIDFYRSARVSYSLERPEVVALAEESPADDIFSELFPCVQAMVSNLPEQDRQALILTEYQGLTQKEYGERLGLSFSGAKSRVQRARQKLKQELLACCHFELDRRGHILDYQPRCDCCEQSACSEDTFQRTCQQVRPFLPGSVSSSKGKREEHSALPVVMNGKETYHEYSSPK